MLILLVSRQKFILVNLLVDHFILVNIRFFVYFFNKIFNFYQIEI